MKVFIKMFLILGVVVMLNHHDLPAQEETGRDIRFIAINHASFVILADSATIFVDPVGDTTTYKTIPQPDIILITHGHRDHYDKNLIGKLKKENTFIVGPKSVIDDLTYGQILNNNQSTSFGKIRVEAIPAYNTTPERLQNHPKGAGNGYVVTISSSRIYISGDTEDIPEMRKLKNIDYAFICMNLPYTMSDEQAASAVLEFKPKVVYPYHYREAGDFSNINRFYEKVTKNSNIKVKFLRWYK